MPLADPANQLVGTPMGPLPGIAPPNPLMQSAMSAPAIPPPAQAAPPAPPSREKLNQALASNKAIGDLLAKLLGSGEITTKAVIDTLGTAVAAGHTTAQQAASEVSKLPQDPQALRALIQQRFLQNMDAGLRMTQAAARLPPIVKA